MFYAHVPHWMLRAAPALGMLLAAGLGQTIAGAAEPAKAEAPGGGDWPQWRGPTRDGIAPTGPKLLDSWPKEGPKLLWKTDWIPASLSGGGMGHPVVADGKVFLYVTWRHPLGGGKDFHLFTDENLSIFGWLPDIPEDLAKKIEAARVSPKRPDSRTRSTCSGASSVRSSPRT